MTKAEFEASVTVGKGQCWFLPFDPGPDGYVYIEAEGAHRIAYRLFKGRILPTQCVRHWCSNRACVNPKHLYTMSFKAMLRSRGGSRHRC